MPPDTTDNSISLLVVGAGHLGGRVARLWCQRFPGASTLAETRSTSRHPSLASIGAEVRLRADGDPETFPNVLVSVPPSAVDDYQGEVERAAGLWRRDGNLVIVSSTAVYVENESGSCNEESVLGDTPRARKLLAAEELVTDAGGIVVRMAGLYERHRGPHAVYLRTETSPRRPDGLVNLIHYDDAATLCVAALLKGASGRSYLGCDDQPIERQFLLDLTFSSGILNADERGSPRCVFSKTDGPVGRQCQNRQTRRLLGWEPRYPTYSAWLEAYQSHHSP